MVIFVNKLTMVFYRKYRPTKISELDSDQVRDRLTSILSAEDISHAFLFTGPKGLGKTSTARIIAKIVNCVNKKGIEPCDECEQCISTANGTNFDVLEIDAASNRGIDEIRDLREKIRLAPMNSAKKVYIIDEVHMLTAEAFDALLKTLEEPPAHAIFILCTTEPHKVPPTIVSRCTHVTFKKATKEELVHAFERIATGENLNVDKKVLDDIASLSDGSFRDGTKILEELAVAAKGKKISQDLLDSVYKTSSLSTIVQDLINELKVKNAEKSLKIISQINEQGIDVKYFIDNFIEVLHSMLLFQFRVTSSTPATGLDAGEIKKLVELVNKFYPQIKFSPIAQLPLEMAIIEYCSKEENVRTTHVSEVSHQANPESQFTSRSLSEAPQKVGSKNAVGASNSSESGSASASDSGNSRQTSMEQRMGGEKDFLVELIEEMKLHNHSVAGVLRGCSAKVDGDKIVLFAKYKFHKEKLEERSNMEALEKVASQLVNKKVQISVILVS